MIDFIKAVYRDKTDVEHFILQKENFEKVYTVLELHSGEILYPYKTKLKILDITIRNNSIEIKNSMHKLFNSLNGQEPHNYNDFNYTSLKSTIKFLEKKLPKLYSAELTQLEFGINIPVIRRAEEIIENNILMHKSKIFNQNNKYRGKGCLIRFDYDNFLVKVYDKAKQYQLDENIFRFEIKMIRKSEFNKLGVFSLIDLKSKEKLKALFGYLLQRFDEMIIVDDYSNVEMSYTEKQKLKDYVSYRYWENANKMFSRQTKMRKKQDFIRLLEKYDLLKTKMLLRNSLIEKFNLLIEN